MSYEEDLTASIAKGATEGLVDSALKRVNSLYEKFRDRKLAFIQDKGTIERVKEQLKSSEHAFYQSYVVDKELLEVIIMGLTLRQLEQEQDNKRVQNLRQRIHIKYGPEGLHIAQLVQIGALSRYVSNIMETEGSIEVLKSKINNLLKNIEKHSYFVMTDDSTEKVVEKVVLNLKANSPSFFIVAGKGLAVRVTKEVISSLKTGVTDYYIEEYSREDRGICFLNKNVKINE